MMNKFQQIFMLHPSAQTFPRFFRVGLVLAAMLFATQSMAADGTGTNQPPKPKHRHHIVVKKKLSKKHGLLSRTKKKTVSEKTASKPNRIHNNVKMHIPHPGAGGEEHSDWFFRRRAWPNQTIDPSFYPNALAEAAKMPVYSNHIGKDGELSNMTWQSIGPYSIDGRVTCIATHPTDSNTFYIGAASGGLWKTTDHGNSWACVTDTFGSLSIGSVSIDPVQPQTIYIGLGECNGSADSYGGDGLWKSTDGGKSWQYLGFAAAQYIAKVLIDPNNHNQIFIASPGPNSFSDTNRGVFRSTDAGVTWSRSLSGGITTTNAAGCGAATFRAGFIDIAMNPLNSAQLVASAWDHSMTIGPGFCPGGSGGSNSGIYLTNDTGNTWQRMDTIAAIGLPNGMTEKVISRIALLWTVNESGKKAQDYLFAAFVRVDTNPVTHYDIDENFEGLYYSSDQGVTWWKSLDSTIKIPMGGIQGKDSANITNAQGGYDFFLAAGSPHEFAYPEIYIGGIDIFRSTDLGLTFKDITDSYSQYYVKDNRAQHSDQHGLAFTAAKSGDDMIVVSDGGVFNTKDFGTTWSQTKGLPITMFYKVEPWVSGMVNTPATISATDLRIMGGTQDNGTLFHGLTNKTQTFGSDSDFAWVCQGDGGEVLSHPTDTNKLIASAAIGQIFARNTLDSLVPNPIGFRDTTHDNLPRWHTLSYRLLYGPHPLTDTAESSAFIVPMALDAERPTDLYTARCHIYRAVLDWNDLENTKWYKWSPTIAGDITDDSMWYYGDIETIAMGVRDASGNPMLWAGGSGGGGVAEVWRTYVNPARADTTAPTWVSKKIGVPAASISQIIPDRSDSLTAFLCTSAASNVAHVMKTTNGGTKWTNISTNLPVSPVSAIVIDTLAEQGNPLMKNQAIIAATDVGVYLTTNGGLQWAQLGTGLPHVIVSDLKIYKNMLIASMYGRSIWALDISDIQAAPPASVESAQAGSTPHLQIFPNPVIGSPSFTVHIETADRAVTQCSLVNESSGGVVPTQIENEGDGLFKVTAKGNNPIQPGVYIVQLFGGGQLVGAGRVSILQ